MGTTENPVLSGAEAAPPDAPASRRGVGLWLVALVLATILVRIPTFHLPLDQDSSVYAYCTQTWVDGGLPYRDAWDHKPPLIYLVYRVLFLFGPASGPGVNLTLRTGSALCDAATAVLLALLARRFFGRRVGVVAGLAFGLFTGAPILQLEAFQPERLTVLLSVAAVYAAAHYVDSRKYVYIAVSGLLFGLALIAKQIAAPVGVWVWAWVTWEALRAEGRAALRRVAVHSLLLAAGAVLPWGLCIAYFAANGALAQFWECTVRFNLFYAEEQRKGSLLAGVAKAIKTMLFDHGFLWVTAAGGVVAALVRPKARRYGVLLAGWIAAAFVALILPGQFAYYYYIPTVAPLAIGCGVALVGLWRLTRGGAHPALVGGVIVASLALLGMLGLAAKRSRAVLRDQLLPTQTNVVVAQVARHIRAETKEGDRIYMRGGRPQVYVLSGRRNACPYLYDFYYGLPPDKAYHYQPHMLKEILADLARLKPPFIVVSARGEGPKTEVFDGSFEALKEYFPRFLDYLDARYSLEKKWPAMPVSLMVFRRKEAP